MFRNISLRVKLLVSFLAAGIIPFLIISSYTALKIDAELSDSASNFMESTKELKLNSLNQYFEARNDQMNALTKALGTAQASMISRMQAMHAMKLTAVQSYFKDRLGDASVFAKDRSILLALVKIGEVFQAEGKKTGGPKWTETVAKYHDWLDHMRKTYGYYDVFLFDKEGYAVYTAARERDLGQNFFTGELKDTNLGRAVQKAYATNSVVIVDFERYAPSDNKPQAFIVAPLTADSGMMGALAFQIDPEKINEIMTDRTGLGTSGDSFLVGADKRMRTDSIQTPQSHNIVASFAGTVEKNGIDSYAVRQGLSGKTGADNFTDYRGITCMGIYAPVQIQEIKWVMILKMDVEEAFTPKDSNGEDFLSQYREIYDITDVFVIASDGYCFYAAQRDVELRHNFLTGKFRNSALGRAFRKAAETKQAVSEEMELYTPKNIPSAFVAAPIFFENKLVSVVALQLSARSLTRNCQAGLQQSATGDCFVVGPDFLMRSDSRGDSVNRSVVASWANPDKGKIQSEAVKEALAGKAGTKLMKDFRGIPCVISYAPVKAYGFHWALIRKVDASEAFATMTALQWAIGILFILGTAAVVAFALFLSNSIGNPIGRIVAGLTASAEQVASASTQMSKAGQEVSEGASEQASTLEQVSSSLEELTAMTKQNADNSGEAEKLAAAAKNATVSGNGQMSAINEAMKEISAGSDEMQKIIKSIQEITFQTNMLALNAAVEAARAGEHGRGFAVVAEEVRNLARKAADFAKTTEALVMDSSDQIKKGVNLSQKTTEIFNDILAKATKVSELAAEVSAATQEQARGLNQITMSVTDMDKVVQGNAANAEEGASTSEELNSQAKSLEGMVQELAGIIGGSKQAAHVMAKRESQPTAGKKAGAKMSPMVKGTVRQTPKMAHKPQEGSKLPVKPEEVIPLNEEEFKDF